MSPPRRKAPRRPSPEVFAALGDSTRLGIITRLARARCCTLSKLTAGASISRQAITKHLRVLEHAGLVHCKRSGREVLYEFNPGPLSNVRGFLEDLSAQWDDALSRLKLHVEG